MHTDGESILLSASDLVGHLNCRYLTFLDMTVARGELRKPTISDPQLDLLIERGALHEKAYLGHLRTLGLAVTTIEGVGIDENAVAQTFEAMRSGAAIIAQAALHVEPWSGRADVLRRVEKPSHIGAWSYEVVDTKLARETKGNTVLQLCLYTDLLAAAQKVVPEFAYVVVPESNYEPQAFRIADYAAYYRRVKASLRRATLNDAVYDGYPEPIEHCDICRWRLHCDGKRRVDDHLSLVAGISKLQIGELRNRGIATTADLAVTPLPLPWKPDRGAAQSYERIREQARIQVQGRQEKTAIYESLTPVPGFGLSLLPPPSLGDVFLDFEGDPFVEGGGLEFLFGYAFDEKPRGQRYVADWAVSREEEKRAFERFVDFVVGRMHEHPGLHIYHFAPYEPAALKRLMGRYATREDEIDRMLRAGVFVDLYAVVRHSIRASVESYSIKKLEPLYAFERSLSLANAGKTLAKVQACLELGDVEGIQEQDRTAVEGYNRDDCLSAWKLRDWLEDLREGLIKDGVEIARPAAKTGEASKELSDWQKKIETLVDRLTRDVPADPAQRSIDEHSRWLLAYILDWHRREAKSIWWEYFRLSGLSSEELLDERAALSGLTFLEKVGGKRVPIHRYSFPSQDTDLRGDEELRSIGGAKFGKALAISLEDRTIDIRKRGDTATLHPEAVFAHEIIETQVLADALVRLGEYVADYGMDSDGAYQAARDLLMSAGPRIGDQRVKEADETALAAAIRVARHLEAGIFPIQGPPGAGKTYTGGRMICALVQSGKTVGITANSHKVIRKLIDEAFEAAGKTGVTLKCIQKVREEDEEETTPPELQLTSDNETILSAIGTTCQVAGGTAWLWAREDAFQKVDVLFIDEAAQMSLANVLAASQAASSVVLLGDPRQLEQPVQGSHPEGVDISALDYVLGTHATIPPDRGLFLEETWRLHPDICAFTSELFYEGRLRSRAGLERQAIVSSSRLKGSGLRFMPVVHEGNQTSSPEEADAIHELVTETLSSGAKWVDRDGKEAELRLQDFLIIAPYNAQVFELQDRLPDARIGTVDKFQGQEAPIVIYSITSSTHADAPRGMEFLYSPNRLNVATSRAKALCLLVGSPQIFEAECRTPRQMQLANAFCRYLEVAASI